MQVRLTCKHLHNISTPLIFATVRLSDHVLSTRDDLTPRIKRLASTLIFDDETSIKLDIRPDIEPDWSNGAEHWSRVQNVFITADMTAEISRKISDDRWSAPGEDTEAEDDDCLLWHPALSLLKGLKHLTRLNFDRVDASDSECRIVGNILRCKTLDELNSLKHVVLGLSCQYPHALRHIAPQKSSTDGPADFEVTYVYRNLGHPTGTPAAMSALGQSISTVLASERTKIVRIINSSYILGDLTGKETLPDALAEYGTEDGVRRALESPINLSARADEPIGQAVRADDQHRVRWLEALSTSSRVISALVDVPSPRTDLEVETVDHESALTGLTLTVELFGAQPGPTDEHGNPFPDRIGTLGDQE